MTDTCSPHSSQSDTSKFVIPKKTKSQEYSLNDLQYDDSFEKDILEETLAKSNFDLMNSLSAYRRTQMKRVENKGLEDEFLRLLNNKKAQLVESNKKLHNLKNKTSLIERVLFYVVKSDAEMMDIVKNGFTCRPSDDDDCNVLGSAAYGLHLSKHLDITLMYQYYLKLKSFYVIVVKTFYSAFRLSAPVPEKNKQSYPDPSDGFEMSNQLPQKDQPIKVRYYNSLVYLFDNDEELNIIEKPRNIFAWAVLKYEESVSLPIEKEFINLYINPNSKDLKYQMKLKKQQQQLVRKKKTNEPKTTTPLLKPAQPFRFRPQQPQTTTAAPAIQPFGHKPPEPAIHISQPVSNFNPASEQIISPILPKFERPGTSGSQKKKLISVFGSDGSESEPDDESDDENWAQFCYQYYMENFNDLIEEIHTKPPRWRIIYERTGRLGVKFKSEQQLRKKKQYKSDARFEVRLEDIRKTKLKFIDADKNKVNIKDPTNNLILTYHLKRMKNNASTTSLVKTEPNTPVKNEPKVNNLSKEQKIERHKKLAEYSQILSEIKKKAESKSEAKAVRPDRTQPAEKKARIEPNLDLTKDAQLKIDQVSRQNFWEPDKNSEFYLTRIRTEKCEPFTDVLILTRLSLNKKLTIEYSKQFYDSNSSLFEAEMQKFVRLNKSVFPCDEWTRCKVESHVKVPLRPQAEPQTRREKFRQKFVHHIKTRNAIGDFQVDNLNKYAEFRDRVEIHAGGFNGLVVGPAKKNCHQADSTAPPCQPSQTSEPAEPTALKAEASEPEAPKPQPAPPQPTPQPISQPSPPPIDQAKKKICPDSRTETKKRLKLKKKLKHKKKKIKKILNSSSSDLSTDSSPERHKKSKYSDTSESDSDDRHRHKRKHKHKHKRNRFKNDSIYDFPTYDFDLDESIVEHEIKTELDQLMVECTPQAANAQASLTLPIARPVAESTQVGLAGTELDQIKVECTPQAANAQASLTLPIARPVAESMQVGPAEPGRSEMVKSRESTPGTQPNKVNWLGTPDNQRQSLRPQQCSSTPGFRFNRTATTPTNTSQVQRVGPNGCTSRATSNPNNQAANASSLKVYRFNPVKTIQPRQGADPANPTANV